MKALDFVEQAVELLKENPDVDLLTIDGMGTLVQAEIGYTRNSEGKLLNITAAADDVDVTDDPTETYVVVFSDDHCMVFSREVQVSIREFNDYSSAIKEAKDVARKSILNSSYGIDKDELKFETIYGPYQKD